MNKTVFYLAGLCSAMFCAYSCQDVANIEISDVTPTESVVTKSSTGVIVDFPQNLQYTKVVDGLWMTDAEADGATVLDLKINVPADGTYTGVSVRSAAGRALSGRVALCDGAYLAAESDVEPMFFAEFRENGAGAKFYDLEAGSSFSFRLILPPCDYPSRDLIVRLHATGTKVYEAAVAVEMAAGGSYESEITPSATAGNNWISVLPDDAPVSALSIPGTHDAATGDGTTFSLGRTQSLTLGEQWDMGIRMFDLRPGYKKIRSGWFKYVDKLHIYHGIVETKTSFEEAIKTLSDKLAANPDEFAIVVMRFENDHLIYNKRDTWNSLMSSFLTSSSFPAERRVSFRPDLTVGEMRGKILILSRDAYASTPSTGAFVSGWSHDASGSVSGRITGPSGEAATLQIQDYYSVDDQSLKISGIKTFADKAASAGEGVWTINHTSGYTGSIGSDSGYKKNAASSNPALYDYIVERAASAGIVVMDHVGPRKSGSYTVYGDLLPQALIDSNFKHKL